jgi:hypothetical protein
MGRGVRGAPPRFPGETFVDLLTVRTCFDALLYFSAHARLLLKKCVNLAHILR